MRILVALIAVFMVSGAMAQKKPTTPSVDGNDVVFCNGINDNDSGLPSDTSFMCKNPKTGKVMSVECKVPPKNMSKGVTVAELQKLCYVPDGRNDGK